MGNSQRRFTVSTLAVLDAMNHKRNEEENRQHVKHEVDQREECIRKKNEGD